MSTRTQRKAYKPDTKPESIVAKSKNNHLVTADLQVVRKARIDPFVIHVLKEIVGVATAAFIIAIVFLAFAHLPIPFKIVAEKTATEFFEHAFSFDIKIYCVAGFFGGLATMFSGGKMAEAVQNYVCRPLISLLLHSAALALGASLALWISTFVFEDYRMHAGQVAGVVGIISMLTFETGLARLVVEKEFVKKQIPELHWGISGVVGIVLCVTSLWQLFK